MHRPWAMRVTTSLDLVSRCRVYARDPREPKTRRPGCIKTSPNQKPNGKNGTGRGKLPGPFLSVPSKQLPNRLHTSPLPTPERRHGSMSALLHAQCSVRMRTYVCSGCWMWLPRSGSPCAATTFKAFAWEAVDWQPYELIAQPIVPGFSSPEGWAGQGHGWSALCPTPSLGGGGVIPFPYRRPRGFATMPSNVDRAEGGRGVECGVLRRRTHRRISVRTMYEGERASHTSQALPRAACRQHAFAEPVRAIVSSVPPTPVHTSSTPAGSNNGTVLFLACL